LKIEIGKKYVTNRGDLVEIVGRYTNSGEEYFVGVISPKNNENNQHTWIYLANGKIPSHNYSNDPAAIKEEYFEPFTSEAWVIVEKATKEIHRITTYEPAFNNPEKCRKFKVRLEEIR
jgi:hypothetical protein